MRIVASMALAAISVCLSGCITSGDQVTSSSGSTSAVAGAEGGATKQLASCEKPLGTVLVSEPDATANSTLQGMGLQSPAPFLRIMMSQSNCFRVIDPAFAAANKRGPSANWIVTPNVMMSNPNAGGMNAAGLLSAIPGVGMLSSAAGSVHTKEAETALFISEAKTGVQIVAVQGHAQSTDFDTSFITGGRGGGNLGAYTNTPEGKVIMAAYADAFNNLVAQMKGRRPA